MNGVDFRLGNCSHPNFARRIEMDDRHSHVHTLFLFQVSVFIIIYAFTDYIELSLRIL